MTLETIGFWFLDRAPNQYPRPQALVGPWDPATRAHVLAYLNGGHQLFIYGGPARCRFACRETLGNRDLTDGTWVWPEGLGHYVELHDVQLPERFVAHAVARGGVVAPAKLPSERRGLFDDGPWLAWSRGRGACVDLTGWEIPGSADRTKILEALGVEAEVSIARADTREVVLQLEDGALEIRQLTPDGHAPRRLAGWHEWPVQR
jgi:hypothetical protein